MTGTLGAARSDATAVTIGGTAYVVGGYTGGGPDAQVLATSDGRHFRSVAALRVPVRYPAIAAFGGKIFVFGGQAVTGPAAGKPVNTIQVIDPARRSASVAGHLPEPVAGAAAVTVGGQVYVAGGDAAAPPAADPGGLGSTQFGSVPAPGHDSPTVSAIWAFDPVTALLPAGHLQVPVSHAGVAVLGSTAWIVGGESERDPMAAVQMFRPNPAFGAAGAPGAGSPYFGGQLLIADRGNNRLLVLDARCRSSGRTPRPPCRRDRPGFYFPDDAFFIHHGTAIISNQEQNETIVEIGYPVREAPLVLRPPGPARSAPGYLHEPDDAYLLKNGHITVADAENCRILVHQPERHRAHQIGTTGSACTTRPRRSARPNGDTPLANGNVLVSEINGSWMSEYTPTGHAGVDVHLPIGYPSDPQQLGPDLYLIADYASPGQILEFNRRGQILYRYAAAVGPGSSTTRRWPSCSRAACSWSTTTTATAWWPSTRPPRRWSGSTASPASRARRAGHAQHSRRLRPAAPNGTTPTHRFTG